MRTSSRSGCCSCSSHGRPFWERNYFLTAFPALHEIIRNNYLRGAVSGLGVVNLLMGFNELASVLLARRRMETMETIEQS